MTNDQRPTTIFHITSAGEADAAKASGTYVPRTFEAEGFVHCSYQHQLDGVASRFFRDHTGLVVLEIDPSRLTCDVQDENLEGGLELFPHIYGKVPLDAVVAIHEFPMGLG